MTENIKPAVAKARSRGPRRSHSHRAPTRTAGADPRIEIGRFIGRDRRTLAWPCLRQ